MKNNCGIYKITCLPTGKIYIGSAVNLLKRKQNHFEAGETKSGHKNTDEMVVDHCHKTKKVRGLLCNRCNTLLGLIDDSPTFMKNITNYLNK